MNGVPGALQNRDPACAAAQVNSRHFFAVSTILTCFFTNGFTNALRCNGSIPNVFPFLRSRTHYDKIIFAQSEFSGGALCQ